MDEDRIVEIKTYLSKRVARGDYFPGPASELNLERDAKLYIIELLEDIQRAIWTIKNK